MAIPFATSIVLVMGSPEADAAQPRALIGGHIVSTIVGLLALYLVGPAPWAAALAVGLAIAAMHFTRTFHPPAGIDPLLVVVNQMPLIFLLVPVAIGAFLLALFAFAWHLLLGRSPWPTRWW
jgi:CBS-domain-containing membrane protein